jgi:hypothetical protein
MTSDRLPRGNGEAPKGGSGGASTAQSVTDVKLAAIALGERWPMRAETRDAITKRLEAIATDPKTRPRLFMHTVKALTLLSRCNLAAIETALKCHEQQEMQELLGQIEDRLGMTNGI